MELRRQGKSSFIFAVAVCVLLMPMLADAACTWKFDWYCSGCAKIGGRTTGTQGGYASEAACESARDQVRSPVSSMSCDRVGWCDEPSKPPSSPQTNTRDRGYTSPQPDYEAQRRMNEENRRQEEARQQAERERKAREQRAFDKAKTDTLKMLKGSSLDQSSNSNGAGSTLKLKSSTPTFGIKGNPVGQLRLKSAGAVKLKNPENAVADPSFFTRPKARLRIRQVPNPMQAPKGTWLRYVKSDRANLILDALEEGKGDLDYAINYLDAQILQHDSHRAASSALSFLEGLRISHFSAGAEYRKRAKGSGQFVDIEAKGLLQAILTATGYSPKNKPAPADDWRVKRDKKMGAVWKGSGGNLEKIYKRLRSDKETIVARNTEYYLRGVYAYWDFLAVKGGKK